MTPTRSRSPFRFPIGALTAALLLVAPAGTARAQQTPPQEPAAAPASEPRTVRVSAEGYDRDDALKQALRKALEQGAGTQIASYSQAESFVLVRDTIYSRAAGIVSDYRILKEDTGAGGVFVVEIEATVRPDAVAAAWGEVQNVLDQIGRPKIMVWIDESIDGQKQEDSVVAARVEQMFVQSGFDLVERRAVEEIRKRERESAELEQDAAKLAALAKTAGAHIFIRGTANANRAGIEELYGVPVAMYNCDVQAKIYYADTGKLLASESLPSTRAGVRSRKEFSPQAARSALVQATFPERPAPGSPPPLARRLYESVMQQWATRISFSGQIELEVADLDFRGYVRIRNALRELDPKRIRSVDGEFTTGIGHYRIQAQMSAETLAELLIQPPLDELLEVVDLKLNRIQARGLSK